MGRLFTDLDIDPLILDAIEDMRFKEMTPIQGEAIPILLKGHDLIGTAQTGTGKTAAFLIPLMDKIIALPEGVTRALILTPTRELALQIDEQVSGLGFYANLSSACIVGGLDFAEQERAIRSGVDILIATPGRLIDHMRYDHVDLSSIQYVVLDEADRMLDIGFHKDIVKIFQQLPKDRQTVLFSATMNDTIVALANQLLSNPKRVSIGQVAPASAIRQKFFYLEPHSKERFLLQLLRDKALTSVLIFVRTKREVRSLESRLYRAGLNSDCLHGDMEQQERNAALERFRRGEISILVATDVASRGLDISNVSHVINFDVPTDPDDYIHRVGRTARAEKDGDAITFVTSIDEPKMDKIEKALGKEIILEFPYGRSGGSNSSQRHSSRKKYAPEKSSSRRKSQRR